MNLLVLNYEYPPVGGGGAAVCRDLCEMEAQHGNRVEVVTMGFGTLPAREEQAGVKIHRVKCWRKEMRVCHPWEQLSYCVQAYRYIRKNIDMSAVDMIHCHFIIPTGLLAIWLKKKYRKKVVITAHGSDVLGHNNARFKTLYKLIRPGWVWIVKNADALTAPSPYLIEEIKRSYPPPAANCRCLPNGIHTERYHAGKKRKSIVTLARLQESKGVQDLLDACARLDMTGWEVNILGDGPYRAALESLAKEKQLENTVFFRGHVVGAEKEKYLQEAAIYFSGSRFESFALSVLEAALSGCCVVASDIAPHRDLVGDAHIYRTQQELTDRLRRLLVQEPAVYQYGVERFDWQEIYRQYMDLFAELQQGGPG